MAEDRCEMDSSKTVVLRLAATNEIEGWLNKSVTPSLLIRCLEHKTDVFVETNLSAQPELGSYNEFTVEVRLDNRPKRIQHWSESTDHEALFCPECDQPRPAARQFEHSAFQVHAVQRIAANSDVRSARP